MNPSLVLYNRCSVIAFSGIAPLSAPEPPADTAPPLLPAGGRRLVDTPVSSSTSSGSSSPAPPTVDDFGSEVKISGSCISVKSVSVTSVGSVEEPLSPIKTVPEPASITFEPSEPEIPAGSSPVSQYHPYAAFCVPLGWFIFTVAPSRVTSPVISISRVVPIRIVDDSVMFCSYVSFRNSSTFCTIVSCNIRFDMF